ncbi:MAG: aminotransferase class I/II-fold pyridoxal phosphate-dependent enzyme, partial [Bdellovibrionota bacterium]
VSAAQGLQAGTSHGYSSYRSLPGLRSAMADWYLKTYQVKVDPACEVLPLLGSKEGIFYLSMAFLNPGDHVLIPDPGYPAYGAAAELVGAQAIRYPLTQKCGWLPDLDALEAGDLSKFKIMWVNYPHMPTGARGSRALFEKLAAFARRNRIMICNDNPYGLVLNQAPPESLLSADPALEWSLELNSLSKSFNMAGWRVGMLLGAKVAVDAVVKVKSNVDSGMFAPIQAGAIAALKNSDTWHRERNQIYAERRELVAQIFDRLQFSHETEQVGLFIWAKAPPKVGDVPAFCDEVLLRHHIFLTPGSIFGTNGARYARASLCAPAPRLREALARLEHQP